MVCGKLFATWAVAVITGATAACTSNRHQTAGDAANASPVAEAVASPSSPSSSGSSGSPSSDAACVNSPSNRACWTEGFDLSTNYYDEVPDTGVVREYWFNVENGTAAPDGYEMPVQLINGSFPGPTIIADWGDTVGTYFRTETQVWT